MTTKVVQIAVQPSKRLLWAQFRDAFGDVSGTLPAGEAVEFTTSDPDVVNVRPTVEAAEYAARHEGLCALAYDAIPLAAGTATLTAQVGGSSLSVDVEVVEGDDDTLEFVATDVTAQGKPIISHRVGV